MSIDYRLFQINPDKSLSFHPWGRGKGYKVRSPEHALEISKKLTEEKSPKLTKALDKGYYAFQLMNVALILSGTFSIVEYIVSTILGHVASIVIDYSTKKEITSELPESPHKMNRLKAEINFLSCQSVYKLLGHSLLFSFTGTVLFILSSGFKITISFNIFAILFLTLWMLSALLVLFYTGLHLPGV